MMFATLVLVTLAATMIIGIVGSIASWNETGKSVRSDWCIRLFFISMASFFGSLSAFIATQS